jgi:hypothetical protein
VLDNVYSFGTDMGPVTPFSGSFAMGVNPPITLTFTVIDTTARVVTVQLIITDTLTGQRCYQKVVDSLPVCHWVAERSGHSGDHSGQSQIGNAMLVYPNPASNEVNISYDYGGQNYNQRSITIYDELGRKAGYTAVPDNHGKWIVNTTNWMPGIYVIRMEGDGRMLQTQRLVVSN